MQPQCTTYAAVLCQEWTNYIYLNTDDDKVRNCTDSMLLVVLSKVEMTSCHKVDNPDVCSCAMSGVEN